MNSKDIRTPLDPDLAGSIPAMLRAALTLELVCKSVNRREHDDSKVQ